MPKKQAENGGAKRGLFVLDFHDFGTKQSAFHLISTTTMAKAVSRKTHTPGRYPHVLEGATPQVGKPL
jgi:hypothetical protein